MIKVEELKIKLKEELEKKLGREVSDDEFKGISYPLLNKTNIQGVEDVNWDEDFNVYQTRDDFLSYVFQDIKLDLVFNIVSRYGSFETFEKEIFKKYNSVYSKDRKVVQLGSIAPF